MTPDPKDDPLGVLVCVESMLRDQSQAEASADWNGSAAWHNGLADQVHAAREGLEERDKWQERGLPYLRQLVRALMIAGDGKRVLTQGEIADLYNVGRLALDTLPHAAARDMEERP